MVRLFKSVKKILQNHMQLDEALINEAPDLSQLDNSGQQLPSDKRVKITDMKKGSIAYQEYREFCHLITKLIETAELFTGVN